MNAGYTNQQVIDAFYSAGAALGLSNPWDLMYRAGLDLTALASSRDGPYNGPDIDALPDLSGPEKSAVKSRLPASRPTGGLPQGFIRTWPDLASIPLAPPQAQKIEPGPDASPTDQALADTWNRYGGLLQTLAGRLAIDPAAAVAVLTVEAGGRGFAPDGRMMIRFENHIFYNQWGANNPDAFGRYFQFSREIGKSWQGHLWRPVEDRPWREVHLDQAAEWGAFEFARGLSEAGALLSISMGAPQVMGFNYPFVGYASVQDMFEEWSTHEASQIVGFFDFVRGPHGDSSLRLQALQQLDLRGFAAMYNGPGQATVYAGLLQANLNAFRELRNASGRGASRRVKAG